MEVVGAADENVDFAPQLRPNLRPFVSQDAGDIVVRFPIPRNAGVDDAVRAIEKRFDVALGIRRTEHRFERRKLPPLPIFVTDESAHRQPHHRVRRSKEVVRCGDR